MVVIFGNTTCAAKHAQQAGQLSSSSFTFTSLAKAVCTLMVQDTASRFRFEG